MPNSSPGKVCNALPSLQDLKKLANGDPDYELVVSRLKQMESLLQARAQMMVAKTPHERLEVKAKLDKARKELAEAV